MSVNTGQMSATLSILYEHVLAGDVTIIDFMPVAFGVALPTTGATDAIVIDMDASFVLYYMNGNVSQPAGTNIPAPDILIDIKNQGSGRYFSKSPMHWNSVIGNAQNPFYIPEPFILSGGSNVQITLTNLSGGSFARVDLTWVGVKVRPLRANFDLQNLMTPLDYGYDFAYTRG